MSRSKDLRTSRSPQTADDAAPILVRAGTVRPTYGEPLRHLAEMAGTVPQRLMNSVAARSAYDLAGSGRTLNRWSDKIDLYTSR